MAYITVDDVKAYLGVTTTADDAVLSTLVKAAETFIDTYTNRRFEATHGTVLHTGANILDNMLWLSDDLLELEHVEIDNRAIDINVVQLCGKSDGPYYAILSDEFTSYIHDTCLIKVTGQWGYSRTAPDDIKHACTRLTAYYYRQRDAQVFDVTAMPDAGILTVPRGLPQDVRLILDNYRRMI